MSLGGCAAFERRSSPTRQPLSHYSMNGGSRPHARSVWTNISRPNPPWLDEEPFRGQKRTLDMACSASPVLGTRRESPAASSSRGLSVVPFLPRADDPMYLEYEVQPQHVERLEARPR